MSHNLKQLFYNKSVQSIKLYPELDILDKPLKKIDKWIVYEYSESEFCDYVINHKEIKSVPYDLDYPLYLQNIKHLLKSEGYLELSSSIYVSEYHNFELLGISKEHPDRSSENTFIFKETMPITNMPKLNIPLEHTTIKKEKQYLSPISLTTHTTAHIWKAIEEHKFNPPHFVIGTAFRRETEDSSHHIEFDNLDICVKGIKFEDLVSTIRKIFSKLNFQVTIRRTRYPYVEPAIEGFINKQNTEIEVVGAGLFNDNLLNLFNIDTTLLGAGFGLARIYLIHTGKSKISEISEV